MVAAVKTSVIYEPRGKAGEYNGLALNLYAGCGHRCVYCYAPNATHTTAADFGHAIPRVAILEKLQTDANKLRFEWTRPNCPIFLCFTCDPYQHLDVKYQLTRQAIQILKAANLDVMILTKGGVRAERDFDLLTPADQFGVTLTCLDNAESFKWEPGAADPSERIDSLRKAHSMGIQTWVSIEPVIDPSVSLELIRQTHEFVDLYKVGKMNYHPIAKTINWRTFGQEAVELLTGLCKRFYLKDDLKKYLN